MFIGRQIVCALWVSVVFSGALVTLALSQQKQDVASSRLLNGLSGKAYQFRNGFWFDGQTFQQRSFYTVHGVLTKKKPSGIAEVIDLQGGWVVPPFGDAHSHHFDSTRNIEQQIQMYLREGIFYAMVQTDVRTGAEQVATRVNTPTSVDVVYAHGGLTGTHSHPITGYEARALGYYGYAEERKHAEEIRRSAKREGDAYYTIDTAADLDRQWPRVLAGKPDFIKVYLLHSERYAADRKDRNEGEGLVSQLLPLVVDRAHKAGLRVSAHVDSAVDYRTALGADVDIMAHLPGYWVNEGEDIHNYELTRNDARETAKRHVFVVPTASLVSNLPATQKRSAQANQIRNLRLLQAAGVRLGIGTDSYGTSSRQEALYLSTLGVFSNLELLKLWCEVTPRAVFPHRKLGILKEGYEASFIVLKENPLEKFGAIRDVTFRLKQGQILSPGNQQ